MLRVGQMHVFDMHLTWNILLLVHVCTIKFDIRVGHHKSTKLLRNTEGCKNKSQNLG